MLSKTLGIIAKTCRGVITKGCKLEVMDQYLIQTQARTYNFAQMVSVRGVQAPIHNLHFGVDEALARALAAGEVQGQTFATISEGFLEQLAEQISVISRRGHFIRQKVDSPDCHLRGIRSIHYEITTEHGKVYVVTDLASQVEIGRNKSDEFEAGIANAYMRSDFLELEELNLTNDITSLLKAVSRLETDINLELYDCGKAIYVFSGIVLEQGKLGKERIVRVSWDWPDQEQFVISPGSEVVASFGIMGRLFQFRTPVAGIERADIGRVTELPCVSLVLPATITTSQRRRSFRIEPTCRVVVNIEAVTTKTATKPGRVSGDNPQSGNVIQADLADISFGGVKLIAPRNRLQERFSLEQVVRCTFTFPGETEPVSIFGTVIRLRPIFGPRNAWYDDLGLEFLFADQKNKAAMTSIQQFILSEQRQILAQRVAVKTS